MKLDEYQQRAKETAIYRPDLALHYLVPALLIELDELNNAIQEAGTSEHDNVLSEAGDVLWMLAQLATTLNHSLESIYTLLDYSPAIDQMLRAAIALQASWVKCVRDYEGDFTSYLASPKSLIDAHTSQALLSALLHGIEAIAVQKNSSLSLITQANIDKLESRQRRGQLKGSGDHR